ncbi:MAG: oligosaccharide flippase family protein [Candidatus Sericytochromatia bacterium]|nr:oligosaccharide flippase family protein [Candidatus Sericytochromatia bacterium]
MTARDPTSLALSGRLSFLMRDSMVYGGASALSKACTLITFPLLARHLSTVDFGLLDLLLTALNVIAIVVVWGQDSAVARYYYDHEDAEERRQLISQSLATQMAWLAPVLLLLWGTTDGLAALLPDAPTASSLWPFTLAQLPFVLLQNVSQNLLKWTFERGRFLALTLGAAISQALLVGGAVVSGCASVQTVLVITLVTSATFGLLGLWFIRRWLSWPHDTRFVRTMLPFALPMGMMALLGALSPLLERGLLDGMLGAEALGLYAAGSKVAMVVAVGIGAFQTAWGPFSLALRQQHDAIETYNKVLVGFTAMACLVALGLAALAEPLVVGLASARYAAAAPVVFPLVLGLTIQATAWITEVGITFSRRSHLGLVAHVACLAASFTGMWVLTPPLGLMGLGLGVLGGQLVRAGLATWLAQRVHPLRWRYGPAVGMLAWTAGAGFSMPWAGAVGGNPMKALVATLGLAGVAAISAWGVRATARGGVV